MLCIVLDSVTGLKDVHSLVALYKINMGIRQSCVFTLEKDRVLYVLLIRRLLGLSLFIHFINQISELVRA